MSASFSTSVHARYPFRLFFLFCIRTHPSRARQSVRRRRRGIHFTVQNFRGKSGEFCTRRERIIRFSYRGRTNVVGLDTVAMLTNSSRPLSIRSFAVFFAIVSFRSCVPFCCCSQCVNQSVHNQSVACERATDDRTEPNRTEPNRTEPNRSGLIFLFVSSSEHCLPIWMCIRNPDPLCHLKVCEPSICFLAGTPRSRSATRSSLSLANFFGFWFRVFVFWMEMNENMMRG